jgi:hypothetical protein
MSGEFTLLSKFSLNMKKHRNREPDQVDLGQDQVHLGQDQVHLGQDQVHLDQYQVDLDQYQVHLDQYQVDLDQYQVHLDQYQVDLGQDQVHLGQYQVHREPVCIKRVPIHSNQGKTYPQNHLGDLKCQYLEIGFRQIGKTLYQWDSNRKRWKKRTLGSLNFSDHPLIGVRD